jgi:hypothetical protein
MDTQEHSQDYAERFLKINKTFLKTAFLKRSVKNN